MLVSKNYHYYLDQSTRRMAFGLLLLSSLTFSKVAPVPGRRNSIPNLHKALLVGYN